MSLDRLTLSAYFREVGARVAGRRIEKVRPHGRFALRLELSSRDALFLDVSRPLAGFWLLPRSSGVPADDREAEGPSRSAALLFKKHLEGARVESVAASPARLQTVATSRGVVVLRPHGSPGASLVTPDGALAHFGASEIMATPLLPDGSLSGLDLSAAITFLTEVEEAPRADRCAIVAARDPGLLPLLRRWPVSDAGRRRLAVVLDGSAACRPFLSPPPEDDAANLAAPPTLLPFEADGASLEDVDFITAASRVYVALRRADIFGERTRSQLANAKAEVARLLRLKAALERDKGRWPDPSQLRHHAEALLVAPPNADRVANSGSRGLASVVVAVPDPRGGDPLEVRIDPRLTFPQYANTLYGRARNIERQQGAFEERWNGVTERLLRAERQLASLSSIRRLEDLTPPDESGGGAPVAKRYLTSRGLEILFGRSASENHDLTFGVAKREDLWFHVLDAPGGHVILRNREGRANRDDIAEAASLAAFLSERRTEGHVDVQYTERKHVQPAGGGKGRVRVTHAEVIRVAPKDPAGRLRARS